MELIDPLKLKIAAAEATQVPVGTEKALAHQLTTGFETRVLGEPPRQARTPSTDTQLYEPSGERSPSGEDLDPQEFSLRVGTEIKHLQFVAKGGLGIVYRGADADLNRTVAVKFIQQRFADDDEHNARMLREAEITGQLDHPGIVAVHGMGRSVSGRLFYVMRYIKGTSFRDRIERFHQQEVQADEREFEFRAMLKNFVSACETIAYAHNCGILHRDIKPDNIMIGRFGETLIVDWGLAIPIDRSLKPSGSAEQTLIPNSSSNSSDSGCGTLPYMSPEQALGGMMLRPASDVYGLGATLYHLLTGRTAFDGNRYEVLDKVRLGKFAPPRQVRSTVPVGLNAICLKAMSLDPAERYPLASDLAQDVERWLADLPVAAQPEGAFAQAMRWGRRHRGAMRSGVAALIAFATLVTAVAMYAVHAKRQAEAAQIETLTATAGFAKQTLQNDIQLRWSVLQNVVKDPELIELLEKQNAVIESGDKETKSDLLDQLNSVVAKHFQANDPIVPASVWSLLSLQGRQVALQPNIAGRASPMADFAYRDYFHGLGRNFDVGVTKDPLALPHVACVFANSKQNKLVTAFSVPVHGPRKPDGSQPIIGVLAMVVDCHQLTSSILGDAAGPRSAMTVELRNYAVVSQGDMVKADGLVIQHPLLTKEMTDLGAGTSALRHVDAATLQAMRDQPTGLIQLVDPIAGGPAKTAAFSRVSIADPAAGSAPAAAGSSRPADKQWAIIIRE